MFLSWSHLLRSFIFVCWFITFTLNKINIISYEAMFKMRPTVFELFPVAHGLAVVILLKDVAWFVTHVVACYCIQICYYVHHHSLPRVSKFYISHVLIWLQWIEREVALLQKRIDHANEKGWRKQYPFVCVKVLLLKYFASFGGCKAKLALECNNFCACIREALLVIVVCRLYVGNPTPWLLDSREIRWSRSFWKLKLSYVLV